MTATGHALVGAIIAAKFQNPSIAIPLAMFSHIVCDYLPHWDAGTNFDKKSKIRFLREAFVDVALSFIAGFFFLQYFAPQISLLYGFTIIIAAQWLDWIAIPPYVFWKNGPFKKIIQFSEQTNSKLDKPWGIVTQILFVLITFFLTYPF